MGSSPRRSIQLCNGRHPSSSAKEGDACCSNLARLSSRRSAKVRSSLATPPYPAPPDPRFIPFRYPPLLSRSSLLLFMPICSWCFWSARSCSLATVATGLRPENAALRRPATSQLESAQQTLRFSTVHLFSPLSFLIPIHLSLQASLLLPSVSVS